ncbi:ABC transporter ATP-binding protein [Candidatus Uabimicrobium amorphum]|uniref:ABC transporter ATP-binding protein n=1 Tax=Uabimicrobium amorphum TaxID=2596890 RepID=A0A5S9ILA0_UABAM|nr:ABC transporter ATP-binding protein [Candidatus Uabimicrobium amorphum]BBM83130.1 ABC transporter ATP-binding protein [Candidatus Uabimicrobium amorphum]
MLEAAQLSKDYGSFRALNQLDLKILKGEVFCLLGANGAGKSTTINLFLNFIQPSEGTVKINDVDVTQHPLETKKYIAYIPENLMLYPNLSGVENLQYFCGLSGKKYPTAELHNFLQKAGLKEDLHKRRVGKYSKGMRQKVGIAIAIAKQASALLLDEPTSGLDPKASNEFAQLLQELKQTDVAILMATHDLFRAKETGTHIGIMKHGKLVEKMTTEEISHRDLEKIYLEHMHD